MRNKHTRKIVISCVEWHYYLCILSYKIIKIMKFNFSVGFTAILHITLGETRPGGYSQKKLGGVCGELLETLTLFQTKIYDFRYTIPDPTQNSMPYFGPDP